MNGPHDLGGMMGHGAIAPEADEPLFHAGWEARALGVTLACGALGHWNIDESRHARESLPWPIYLDTSYYEIWTRALETLLTRHGLVSADELATGEAEPAPVHPRRLAASAVDAVLARGGPTDRPVTAAPRFAIGDLVRTRNLQPKGHTRLPGYVRGHVGTIIAAHGGFILPDANAHGRGEAPEHLYTVRFEGADLWGDEAEPGSEVMIDAWESYLERA
ncbi:nitrile hydratase subunit beta [Paracoccus zhejiangensis]|uniref:Nitrile hydratase subunit beta n=1 Tax=Paracoccus zhejiangensis TaxID=1077935 RepID=A0A2H5EZ23_9RHOB|nr:nitrile hydratase subunit beta [Paracoccus zhejiangensis]AUH64547.1 nitrile hydratase subunit beta [Paracoccus zhejiangensis]